MRRVDGDMAALNEIRATPAGGILGDEDLADQLREAGCWEVARVVDGCGDEHPTRAKQPAGAVGPRPTRTSARACRRGAVDSAARLPGAPGGPVAVCTDRWLNALPAPA